LASYKRKVNPKRPTNDPIVVPKYAEFRARKTKLHNVLGRLIVRSDPFIIYTKFKFRPTCKPCDKCWSKTHSTKNHNKLKHINNYDDPIIIPIIGKQLFPINGRE